MLKPYFDDGRVTLYLADSLQVDLPCADLIVTDPPYGVTSLEWDRWQAGWIERAATASRSMWCFGSMRMFMDNAVEFEAAGWHQSHDIVWEKHNGSGFHNDRFRRVHEHAIHFYRGEWSEVYREPQYTNTATKRTVRSKSRPTQFGKAESRTFYETVDGGPVLAKSVMFAPSMHGKALHPTEKPVEILLPLIRYGCPPSGVVLDPFAGSGSTLAAARMAGRRAIGFEVNEKYAERAARRLAQGELFAS